MAIRLVALSLVIGFAMPVDSSQAANCREAVTNVIAKELKVARDKIVPGAMLQDNLGADDLVQLELVMALEEAFGIEIEESTAKKLVTVGDVIRLIDARARKGCG